MRGGEEAFCLGGDFQGIHLNNKQKKFIADDPEPLYDLWLRWSQGPYVTIAHVDGRVNAGGIGFVAASDIVIASTQAQFSLSELLFCVVPACVFPFLIQRVGYRVAHYMALMTKSFCVEQAAHWGLVDCYADDSNFLVHQHLLRLRCLSKKAIKRYKGYLLSLTDWFDRAKLVALNMNRHCFNDPEVLDNICRYVDSGVLPWEK